MGKMATATERSTTILGELDVLGICDPIKKRSHEEAA